MTPGSEPPLKRIADHRPAGGGWYAAAGLSASVAFAELTPWELAQDLALFAVPTALVLALVAVADGHEPIAVLVMASAGAVASLLPILAIDPGDVVEPYAHLIAVRSLQGHVDALQRTGAGIAIVMSLGVLAWLTAGPARAARHGRRGLAWRVGGGQLGCLTLAGVGAAVDGETVGALVHDPAVAADPDRLRATCDAVKLSLANERLAAEIRWQLDEVRASRQRFVQAEERARARLERDLHDGAQQRLTAAMLQLRVLQQSAGEGGAELAGRSAGHVDIDLVSVEHRRRVTIADDGRGIEPVCTVEARERPRVPAGTGLVGLFDRIDAHGGTLAIRRGAQGGTTVEVTLPCAP